MEEGGSAEVQSLAFDSDCSGVNQLNASCILHDVGALEARAGPCQRQQKGENPPHLPLQLVA